MNIILLKIESAKYVQEIDLNNETGEVVVKFSCETPLNEMDTCDMLGFYFGEVYYEVSDEDFFYPKRPCVRNGRKYEAGGVGKKYRPESRRYCNDPHYFRDRG